MNYQEKSLYKKIDEILWGKWYPIGINCILKIRNKNHGYIPIIFNAGKQTNEKVVITDILFEIETKRMGFNGNYEKCLAVASEI
jgi:hypothetical protein